MGDSLLLDFNEPTYYEIQKNMLEVKAEVESLDDEALLEECEMLCEGISDIYFEQLSNISSKIIEFGEIAEEERNFLRGVYFMYYCKYSYIVDVQDEDKIK